MEKSLNIKDSKSLIQCYKLINKFRKGFNEDDISFITDVYLRHKYDIRSIAQCDAKIKVN